MTTSTTPLEETAKEIDKLPYHKAMIHRVRLFFLLLRVQIKMSIRSWLDINKDVDVLRTMILGSVGQEQKQRIDNDMVVVKLVQQITAQNNTMARVVRKCEDAVARLEFYETKLPLSNHHATYTKAQKDKAIEESRRKNAAKAANGAAPTDPATLSITDSGEVRDPSKGGRLEATTKSQVRVNAEKDPDYAPYCLNPIHTTNVRMQKVEDFYWQCACGAEHDEREPQPTEPRQGPIIP